MKYDGIKNNTRIHGNLRLVWPLFAIAVLLSLSGSLQAQQFQFEQKLRPLIKGSMLESVNLKVMGPTDEVCAPDKQRIEFMAKRTLMSAGIKIDPSSRFTIRLEMYVNDLSSGGIKGCYGTFSPSVEVQLGVTSPFNNRESIAKIILSGEEIIMVHGPVDHLENTAYTFFQGALDELVVAILRLTQR